MLFLVANFVLLCFELNKAIHYPFTDPNNRGNWKEYDPMTDEFESNTLDESKWNTYKPGWNGRYIIVYSIQSVISTK